MLMETLFWSCFIINKHFSDYRIKKNSKKLKVRNNIQGVWVVTLPLENMLL
jgi:hypothetical protein